MKMGIAPLFVAFLAVSLSGCAIHSSSYFRKPGASVEEERTDWGLCGGNFHRSGLVRADPNPAVLKCMREKGYQTQNEYYVEQHVDFVLRNRPESSEGKREAGISCGMIVASSGFCQGNLYILRSALPRVVQCMSGKGFDKVLPSTGWSFYIQEDHQPFNGNFCAVRTRKTR